MEVQNFVREAVRAIGAAPEGVLIGLIGGLVSVVFRINGKSTWRTTSGILFSGAALGGYALPVISENLKWGAAAGSLACFLIGFLASDFFQALKKYAPGLFGRAAKKIENEINTDGTDSK